MLGEKEKGLAYPRYPLCGRWAHFPFAKGAPARSSTHHMAPILLGTLSKTEVTVFYNLLSEVTPHHLCHLPFSRKDSLSSATFKAQ